ncbi:hypothetical protein CesoFtcFv8_022774 [Champsocephalus esox]|uniref:Uncharacterized protein n=1 Tax=Champsocephalus esox TaxID=159716 RepID=A0AAN8GHS1_9TELE|nr:hypothetical protein CesoFtcFv8_022774 [Champsocephalus esox]
MTKDRRREKLSNERTDDMQQGHALDSDRQHLEYMAAARETIAERCGGNEQAFYPRCWKTASRRSESDSLSE